MTEEARTAAERAVAALERWPGWRAAQAAALVRRATPAGHGGPAGGAGSRPAEREVAALLAEGLSNAQMAQRLYISTKTVSAHVSNILAKLGMASRSEVAAWVARDGLARSGLGSTRGACYSPSRRSSPTVSPGRSAIALTARMTPGMNELRS